MLSPSHGHEGLLPVTNTTVICVFELLVGTSDICCTASAETLKAAAQHFSAQWLSNLFCLIAHTSLLRKWMVKTFRAEWFRALAVSLQIIHRETVYSNLFFILIKWQPKVFDIPGLLQFSHVTLQGADFGLLLPTFFCCLMFALG